MSSAFISKDNFKDVANAFYPAGGGALFVLQLILLKKLSSYLNYIDKLIGSFLSDIKVSKQFIDVRPWLSKSQLLRINRHFSYSFLKLQKKCCKIYATCKEILQCKVQ